MRLKIILSILIIAPVLIFVMQNYEPTDVSFLFWGFSLPRSVMLFGTFCLGTLFGIVLSAILTHGRRKRR